ncbi:MAG TPA: Flp family type IVb pilin [Anaerolineae bacterium]|nr:Flp family type IVb pilin [Anaerolineae bacterium]
MSWIRREEGQDLTEYALIIALIVILGIAALTFLGGNIGNVLNSVAASLANALA